MKRKTKESTREITRTIFEILGVAGFVTLTSMLSNGRNADKLFRSLAGYSVMRIRQTVRRLKLQGMIEYDESDERSPIVLTDVGMKRAKQFEIFCLFSSPRRWDHLWRIVMFDIPERRNKRRMFQYALKSAGFFRLQDSVYVTPYDMREEVLGFARVHGILSDLCIAVTPNLGPFETEARSHFFRLGCRLR